MPTDQTVLSLLEQVSSATLSTILLKNHGLANTCIRDTRRLSGDGPRMVGPAFTFRYIAGREDLLPQQWLGHPDNLIRPTIDGMPAGVVPVLDCGGHPEVGLLGGNLWARMIARGVAGVVTDGGMRDRDEMRGLGVPVFCREIVVPTSFPTLMLVAVQEPVACGGVPVFPGDILVGDADGVVVIPAHLAGAVAEAGAALEDIEQWVHRRLRRGEPLDGLYPPNEKAVAEFEAWVRAGRPADRLVV
ncbi:MAG: ribonuclease activity regulator RraA [Burkholderiaceae bacterium]